MSVHVTCRAQPDAGRAGVVSVDGSGASGPPAEAPIMLANPPDAGPASALGLVLTCRWASLAQAVPYYLAVHRILHGWGRPLKAGVYGTCVARRVLRSRMSRSGPA